MRIFHFFIFSLLFSVVACQSGSKKLTETSWPQSMNSLLGDINELLPYLYSSEKYSDEKNKKQIKKIIKNFSAAAHSISQDDAESLLGKDPLVKYSIVRLNEDIDMAKKTFSEGNYHYSREVLKSTVKHCMRCHSRTNMGPQFDFKNLNLDQIQADPVTKAQILIGTRQYQKAKDQLSSIILSVDAEGGDFFNKEKAIKLFLSLVVRIDENPQGGIQLLDQLLTHSTLPLYLQDNVKSWKKSLAHWQSTKIKSGHNFSYAKKLFAKAKNIQDFPSDQTADIEFLRVASLLHKELQTSKDSRRRAISYSMLGETYEVLSDLDNWELPEIYYESCIRELPKSPVAKSCFKYFERSIIWGFSGSAGTFIPRAEVKRLKELKVLAGL